MADHKKQHATNAKPDRAARESVEGALPNCGTRREIDWSKVFHAFVQNRVSHRSQRHHQEQKYVSLRLQRSGGRNSLFHVAGRRKGAAHLVCRAADRGRRSLRRFFTFMEETEKLHTLSQAAAHHFGTADHSAYERENLARTEIKFAIKIFH
jgi:hypothetical protein